MKHLHISRRIDGTVYSAEDLRRYEPEKEHAIAAGPRNGASHNCKAGRLSQDNTVSLAARHPIIARHWGFTA